MLSSRKSRYQQTKKIYDMNMWINNDMWYSMDMYLSIHQTNFLKGWFHKQRKKNPNSIWIYLSKFSPPKKKKILSFPPLRYEQDHSTPQCLKHLPSRASMEPLLGVSFWVVSWRSEAPKKQRGFWNNNFNNKQRKTHGKMKFNLGIAKWIEGLLAASVDCAFD